MMKEIIHSTRLYPHVSIHTLKILRPARIMRVYDEESGKLYTILCCHHSHVTRTWVYTNYDNMNEM